MRVVSEAIALTVSAIMVSSLAAVNVAGQAPKGTKLQAGGSIAFVVAPGTNAVHTMDPNLDNYSYVQVDNGTITTLTQPATAVPNTIALPAGAAVYPGFIDSHSHISSFSVAGQTDKSGNLYWINLANVNVMQQPACTSGPSTAQCFTPLTTQSAVNAMLSAAKLNAAGWVLGYNYEPSRLVCTSGTVTNYGFLCPNFENQSTQTALAQLDALQSATPLLVTSESGHIAYVNSAALKLLNICPPASLQAGAIKDGCQMPLFNPASESALAQTGQLDEDLTMYAIGYVEKAIAANNPDALTQSINTAMAAYSQLGYTTVQEGAANEDVIASYMVLAKIKPLPATVAFLDYVSVSPTQSPTDYALAVTAARTDQKAMTAGNLDMFIAGIKAFADGSNQGYTGYMISPVQYQDLNPAFTNSKIFPTQPYDGLADFAQADLAKAAGFAHLGGFPLWVHANGNQAVAGTLTALESNQSKSLRDVVIHAPTATQQQFATIAQNNYNIGVTFLMNDFYYYYQPLCQQVLGAQATSNLYPAAWAASAGVHFGLHSDTSVTPPSPLFSMWVASTRSYQQNNWMPPMASTDPCMGAFTGKNQVISRLQALKAYTSDAAWLYNRDTAQNGWPGIGSLQIGFAGDLVVLSADPLAPVNPPDLSTIYVLYTVHNGNIVYQYQQGGQQLAWPN